MAYTVSRLFLLKNSNMTLLLPVGSANMTAWAETLLANESQEIYVELRQDRILLRVTKAAQRSGNWSWNERVRLCVRSHAHTQQLTNKQAGQCRK